MWIYKIRSGYGFSDEFLDLRFLQKEPPRARGVVAGGGVFCLIRRDVGIQQPCLISTHHHIASDECDASVFYRLHLKSQKRNARLIRLEDFVIEKSTLVVCEYRHVRILVYLVLFRKMWLNFFKVLRYAWEKLCECGGTGMPQ